MKIINFMKEQWWLYPVQVMGAGFLLPAFVIAVIAARCNSEGLSYLGWSVLAVVGILDIYIIRKAKRAGIKTVTVTRWLRDLLPKKADNVVMFGFIALVWGLAGPVYALWYMHGFLNDHFNEDRD